MADYPVIEVFICCTIPADFTDGSGPYGGRLQFKEDRVTHLNELKAIIEAGCSELGYTASIIPTARRTFKEYGDVQVIVSGAS